MLPVLRISSCGGFCLPAVRSIAARHNSTASLSENELDQIKKKFARADKNIDFKLDYWEYNDFIKYVMGRRFDKRDLYKVFNEIDLDNDGQLRIEDLVKHFEKKLKKPTDGEMRLVFCRYDKNDDGYIKLHEMRQALYQLGYPSGVKEIKHIFDRYDTDNDRHVTFSQFKDIVLKELPKIPM